MKKKLIVPISIVLSLIIVATIFISYGFVSARISNNELAKKQTFTNQKLEVEYSDGTETLTSTNTSFIPGSTITKEFTIKNTGNVSITYSIKITDLINEFKRPADITYEMYLNDEIIEKTTFPIYDEEPIAGNIIIDKNETQNLKLIIYYNNSTDNQIVDNGSKLGGKLSFEIEQNEIENVLIYGNTITNDDSTTNSLGDSGTITLTTNRNLVKNGFGEYGDNTNFSKLEYDKDSEIFDLSNGGFRMKAEYYLGSVASYQIPVDVNKKYSFSLNAKNFGNENTQHFIGYVNYDIDKEEIKSEHYTYTLGSLTYLTKDLVPGDTEIYVESTNGFKLSEDSKTYQLGLVFWNYIDSTGYKYESETYSRNVYQNLYAYDNVSETTITLNSAWSGDTILAGTKVSQSYQTSTYSYFSSGININTSEWLNISGTMEGQSSYKDIGYVTPRLFRYGTNYISIYMDNAWASEEKSNTNILFKEIYIGRDDMVIENTITISNPLACVEDKCDYIDIKNKKIVRQVSNGSILSSPTYEDVEVPDLSLFTSKMITVSDGTVEASNIKVEYK